MSYTNVVAGIGDAGGNSGWPRSPILATSANMRKHLRRLERVWIDWPIYFVTTCTLKRRSILASNEVAKILSDEWKNAHNRHGWAVGRYVIMPDHVHFFCSAELDAKTLPIFMQAWKQWTDNARAQFSWKYLAGRVLRSCSALERELQSEVGLRERKPGACRIGCKRR